MTIAAGFVHADGVMLCADTQIESVNSKTHEAKVGDFEFPGGKLVYAMAGHAEFAKSAIGKCKRALKARKPNSQSPLNILDETIAAHYRRAVHEHGSYGYDPNLHYWLLIGLWTHDGPPKLYSTWETEIREVEFSQCVGAGEALADHLLRNAFTGGMPEREVLCLAAYVLSIVKQRVPGCGGTTLITTLRNDGTVTQLFQDPVVEHVTSHAGEFFFLAESLFMQHVRLMVSDEDFEKNLQLFNENVMRIRKRWSEKVRQLGPLIDFLTPGARSGRQSSKP